MNVERTDFVSVFTQDIERAKAFYAGTLGLEIESEGESDMEFRCGQVTLDVFDPSSIGQQFAPSPAGLALRVPDVDAARAELEAKGVKFEGETVETGVCRMAFFKDPDGNASCSIGGSTRERRARRLRLRAGHGHGALGGVVPRHARPAADRRGRLPRVQARRQRLPVPDRSEGDRRGVQDGHGAPIALRVADVAETRKELEARGVEFVDETLDSGVCHMAPFADPDGNRFMLHRRYAPND